MKIIVLNVFDFLVFLFKFHLFISFLDKIERVTFLHFLVK